MSGKKINVSLFKASYQSLRGKKIKKQCYLAVMIKFLQIFHLAC